MRPDPWHLRKSTAEHLQWFRNLLDLQRLTSAWQSLTGSELASGISTKYPAHLHEGLWLLERVLAHENQPWHELLDGCLDDTAPEDFLARLQDVICAKQGLVLRDCLKSHTLDVLLQAAEECGRACAVERWKVLSPQSREDCRGLFAAFQDSPFSGYPRGDHFLVLRSTQDEIRVRLLRCPHQSPLVEVREMAGPLCESHERWSRGYLMALNSQARLARGSGCELSLTLD